MCAKELVTLEDVGALGTASTVHAIPVLEQHLYLLVSAHVHGNTASNVCLNTFLTGGR